VPPLPARRQFDLAKTCVLDTEMLTLRVCGRTWMLPSPEDLGAALSMGPSSLSLCRATFATVGLKAPPRSERARTRGERNAAEAWAGVGGGAAAG